jgi:hypothetical protein
MHGREYVEGCPHDTPVQACPLLGTVENSSPPVSVKDIQTWGKQ